ncbi:unnamed protein product [Rotaria socialis]|uniref:peptide chain release factor N(5)-glutamine methyltransferase n=1 Tax=Rotaria socialis TaxID=392032 RepID=A0A817SYV8_9BILA|nr:unnamed protein product [Rotaria socialis]CAF4563744.1 unnamed protein product [Rotaria socialis]
MRSLNYLFRRNIINSSTTDVYRWLLARAQYLQRLSQSHLSYSKSKSLFGIFRSLINQYHRNVPIDYLCGSTMFFNRLFIVNRHVLIPRRDSECLIRHVQQLYAQDTNKKSILEIGTGSGCLSITLSRLFPNWQIHACDISSSALRVARNNAYLHHCHCIQFHRGDLFDSAFLQNTSFNMIVSNPPYIPTDEVSYCDAGIFHEPSIALFVDPPLKFYSEIIHRAKQEWLNDHGYLVFECSPFNAHQIEQLFIEQQQYFENIQVTLDTNQLPRVISAKKKQTFL